MKMCYKSKGIDNFLEVELGDVKNIEHTVKHYRIKMIERNQLEYIFSPTKMEIDGQLLLKYNTQSYYVLNRMLVKYKPNGDFLRGIMEQLGNCILELERYLLDANDLVLDSEYMFYSWKDRALKLIYVPGYEGDFNVQLKVFLEYIMKIFDYKDEEGVRFLYDLYGRLMDGNGDFHGLIKGIYGNEALCINDIETDGKYEEKSKLDEYENDCSQPSIKKLVPLTNGALEEIKLNQYEEMVLVGRGKKENDYRLATTQISRVHACIYMRSDGTYVEDRESTNGTFVNSIRLPALQQARINVGDVVAFANEEFFAV